MAYNQRHDKLDTALGTRAFCVFGLCMSWISGVAAVGGGVYCIYMSRSQGVKANFIIPRQAKEVLPLGINIIVTLLNESMGYIHNSSLRWSLQYEGRLTFNSNLRLLSSSLRSKPNKWYSNIFFIMCIILSYTTTSLIFLGWNPALTDMIGFDKSGDDPNLIKVSGVALTMLGLSLLGQAIIANWALLKTTIPTWSSNPLDTVAACMDESNPYRIARKNNRCMKSVHDIKSDDVFPVNPKKKQGPIATAHDQVKWVLALLWLLVPLGGLWGGSVYTIIIRKNTHGVLGNSWMFLPKFTGTVWEDNCQAHRCTDGTSVLNVGWTTMGPIGDVGSIFLIGIFQAGLTLALHCAELLVNLSRDEGIFRMAISEKGTDPRYNSVTAAFTSWQTITLFTFKAAIHWLYGLAINNDSKLGVSMYPPQIFYFTGFALLVAAFATYVSVRKPMGPLPATFGHLQTMADLIDVWSDRMFWGHKGPKHFGGKPNYAGTSNERLDLPDYGLKYGGTSEVSMSNVSYTTTASSENLPPYYDTNTGYSRPSNGSWNNGYHYYSPA